MSRSWEWKCKMQYSANKKVSEKEETLDHPLRSNNVIVSESRGASARRKSSLLSSVTPVFDPLGAALDGSDPLSQFAHVKDPLSAMAAETVWEENWDTKTPKKTDFSSDLESWSLRKAAILNKFTTSEKLTMVSSFLSGGDKVVVKTQSTQAQRTRLEQLDDFEDGECRMGDLSQQEYSTKIEQHNKELVQAWNEDQRVRALKIAIQCSKMLADTSVIQFYPSKFVLITDLLDIFGQLVYERLIVKSEYTARLGARSSSLPDNFGPEMVPETAKETCRNWFYKISSIRELIPRLYVEAAILKCYSFLDKGELLQAVLRLTRMVRGIGDPLVAVYARCYLCRVGSFVPNIEKQLLKENFYDFLACYHQVFGSTIRAELTEQRVDLATYLTLYTPALDWILQSLADKSSETVLAEILSKCKAQGNSSLLINTIMTAFKPAYIASRASYFVQLISSCNEEGFPQHLLYQSLGLCLSVSEPDNSEQLWKDVWPYITALSIPQHYIGCAEVWLPFVVKNFTNEDVDVFLQDIIQHLSAQRAYEQFYSQLQNMAVSLLNHTQNLESLFVSGKFMPFLDMIRNETVKVTICKSVMVEVAAKMGPVNDPVVTDALMSICQIMHDSVNALTVEDEKRQISSLIAQFLLRVDHGRDFEQQLSFYVDARAAFSNLDYVHAVLVQCVNKLAVETGRVVKGHHTRKTSSFVKACAAYCYITIPSIKSETVRLQLYLLSAQVALSNQCLGQADACLKDSLSLVPDFPTQMDVDGKMKSSEYYLIGYLNQMLSTLLVVPDSPEQGVLYLLKGLLNVLQHYTWDTNSVARARVYLSALNVLSVAAQPQYPYHVRKVDSNDVLYGHDPKFLAEINKMCTLIVEELLNQLKVFGNTEMYTEQASLALDLCVTVILRGDLSSPGLATLAVNLWNLSNRHKKLDSKRLKKVTEYLRRRGSQLEENVYNEVISKLVLPSTTAVKPSL